MPRCCYSTTSSASVTARASATPPTSRGLCARDWGLYTTLIDNLAALGAVVGEIGLQPTDTLALADRSDRLLQLLQQAPKSRSWNLRAKIGRRKRWYETPEEVIR